MKELISLITVIVPKLKEFTFEQLIILVIVVGLFGLAYKLI